MSLDRQKRGLAAGTVRYSNTEILRITSRCCLAQRSRALEQIAEFPLRGDFISLTSGARGLRNYHSLSPESSTRGDGEKMHDSR